MHKRILILGAALGLILSATAVGRAAPLFQARSIVSYPEDGMTVSGKVEIKGVATHPNMNFYQLRYAAGPRPTGESQWVDFAVVEGKQVENDVLATWDTTQIPDGQYTLALAVWGFDDQNSPYVTFVTQLTVNNANPPATPTPEQQQVTPTPVPTVEVRATPTPVTIQQPATPTPRPTPTAEEESEGVPTPTPDEGPSVALNVGELRDSFCTGGLFTILLLALWGLYLLAKIGVRWYLRRRTEQPSMRHGNTPLE